MEDYIHLFVSCPSDYSIRKLVQIIKGGTSFYIRKKHFPLREYKALGAKALCIKVLAM